MVLKAASILDDMAACTLCFLHGTYDVVLFIFFSVNGLTPISASNLLRVPNSFSGGTNL